MKLRERYATTSPMRVAELVEGETNGAWLQQSFEVSRHSLKTSGLVARLSEKNETTTHVPSPFQCFRYQRGIPADAYILSS